MSWFVTAIALASSQPSPAPPPPRHLTMEQAVDYALDRNFGVQRAGRSVRIADLMVDTARAGRRLRLNSQLSVGQSHTYGEVAVDRFRLATSRPDFAAKVGASASLPIDLWGVAGRQVRQAEFALERSRLSLDQSVLASANEVRSNYLSALQAKERAEAAQAVVADIDRLLGGPAGLREDAQPYLRSERDLAQQQADSTQTQAQLALAQLSQSMRLPRGEVPILDDRLSRLPSIPSQQALIEMAGRFRGDLRQAEISLEQALLRARQARDVHRPSLGIDAFADRSIAAPTPWEAEALGTRALGLGVAVRLAVPLLRADGGVSRNEREIADLQTEQALADHAEAIERASNEIDRLTISVESLAARVRGIPDVAQARSALDDAERRLLAAPPGQAGALIAQVSLARETLRSARIAASNVQGELGMTLIALSRAVGRDLFAADVPQRD